MGAIKAKGNRNLVTILQKILLTNPNVEANAKIQAGNRKARNIVLSHKGSPNKWTGLNEIFLLHPAKLRK